MAAGKYSSTEEFLKDPRGDIVKLRAMGIPDFTIITFMVRVQEGQPKAAALNALLLGRDLTTEQVAFVRGALDQLPNANDFSETDPPATCPP